MSQLICNTWKIAVLSMVLLDRRNIDGKSMELNGPGYKEELFFFCIHENHLFSNSFGSLFPLIDILDVTFRSATGRQSARRQSQKKRSRRRDDDVLFVAFLSNHPDFESL